MGNGGLAETDSDLMEVPEIRIRQIGVPFPDVVYGLVHPVALVFFGGLQDAAPVDVAEELVPRPIQELFVRQVILQEC